MDSQAPFDTLIADGIAASSRDQGEEAVRLFEQAAALAPASGVPHFLLGAEHASRGDIEAAEPAFATAVLLAPGFALARYQLGLLQFSSRRAALALLTWEPLLALPGGQPLPHFVRGFAALAQDDFQQALGHFGAGLACPNDNPPLFGDIERVMQEVERLATGGPRPGGTGDAQTSHVLLSTYAHGLH